MQSYFSALDEQERINAFTFLSILLVQLLLTHTTAMDMVRAWSLSHTYNHCFLIIPISLYLIYSERQNLSGLKLVFSPMGGALFLLSSLCWMLFNLADIKLLEQLSFIAQVQSLVLTCVGWNIVKRIWFPLFFMYFSVPMGEELIPWLRDITATFCVALLKLSDIPVFLDNRYISVPNGDFFVAEACSGINYLIATATLGVIYAHYQYRSWMRKGIFLALAIVVPIVANGIRAYGIIMIAYWTNNEYAVGVDHLIYGWIWFGVVLFLLFSVGNLIVEKDGVKAEADSVFTESEITLDVDSNNNSSKHKYSFVLLFVGMIFLSLPTIFNSKSHSELVDSITKKLDESTWLITEQPATQVQYPTAKNVTLIKHKDFGDRYQFAIIEYSRDKQTDVLSSINLPYDKNIWIEIESVRNNEDTWYRVQNNSGNQYWVVARSYLRGERVDSAMDLFVTDVKHRLSSNSNASYVIVMSCANCEHRNAEEKMNQFFQIFEEAFR